MRRAAAGLAIAAALTGCGGARPSPIAAPLRAACDLIAAPAGSDAAAGTVAQPLHSPQQIADRLRPGETGCLRQGAYGSDNRLGYVLRFARGGRAGEPITLRSYPGERATIKGVIYVVRGADYVTLSELDVDDPTEFSRPRQIAVQVNARHTVLEDLDITTAARKTCLILGSIGRFGPALDTIVRDNVLHACGDPENDFLDHAIYIGNARRAVITGNLIWGAGGFAVQLYPNARQSVIRGNVMADNAGGVIFAGEGAYASSGNRVERNIIAGSTGTYNVASFWPVRVGPGNVARDNCLIPGPDGNLDPDGGFAASGNIASDPLFRDPAARDYRMSYATTCSELVGTEIADDALRRGILESGR